MRRVHSVIDLSTIDYPGHLAAVIFFSGCPWRCQMCYNARVVIDPPSMTVNEALDFVKEQLPLIDACVLLGGEPLLHPLRVVEEVCRKLKEYGLLVKLDTNGNYPRKLRYLLQHRLIDFVAMDVKHVPKLERLRRVDPTFTEDRLRRIMTSVQLLKSCNIPYELRTVVVDPLHTVEDVAELRRLFPGIKIHKYSPEGEQLFRKEPLRPLNGVDYDD